MFKVKSLLHPFHLVNPSPWPLLLSVALFNLVIGIILKFHFWSEGFIYFIIFFINVIGCIGFWSRDVIREATFEGFHTHFVEYGLRFGFILFLASEVMFFLSVFWAFFHSALAPAVQVGVIWPPKGIDPLNPWGLPFLNTLILLWSGVTVTLCHHAIREGSFVIAVDSLFCTLVLGILFTSLQGYEYCTSPFSINDSIYGSIFFFSTGFHGIHVLIGTIFLSICFVRLISYHFTTSHHFGFEAAAWYWHFVDVVWLCLFIAVYWWGS